MNKRIVIGVKQKNKFKILQKIIYKCIKETRIKTSNSNSFNL
jgi:hypothetical protein